MTEEAVIAGVLITLDDTKTRIILAAINIHLYPNQKHCFWGKIEAAERIKIHSLWDNLLSIRETISIEYKGGYYHV